MHTEAEFKLRELTLQAACMHSDHRDIFYLWLGAELSEERTQTYHPIYAG